MTEPDRAWRFLHPDLDQVDDWPGLRVASTGGVDMVAGADAVRQSLLLLLSTIPGERVMRPDYGCPLHRLVFSPNDDTTAGLAIHSVRQAVERWEPRVEVIGVEADRDAEAPERLEVTLDYRVRRTRQREALRVAVDLGGAE